MRREGKARVMTTSPIRPRLLLVEDDPDLSQMLAELLDEEGYAVTAVRDGQAGLHRGLVDDWDLLVVDRGLPGIEGVDLVTRLRSQGLRAPVLFLTARGTVADRVEGLDAGAQDYVVKPFDVEECSRGCGRCCDRSAGLRTSWWWGSGGSSSASSGWSVV